MIANDSDPAGAAQEILNGTDPAARSGAAAAALNIASPNPSGPWSAILQRAQADDDMTVRLAAGQDDATAGYWSCPACSNLNKIEAAHCASCKRIQPATDSHPSWTSRIGLMIGPLRSV